MNETENYNETVLIPILQDKVNTLMAQNIVLEAKLQISEKEKTALEKKLKETATPVEAVVQ